MANDNDRKVFSELKLPDGGVIRTMNERTLNGAVSAADAALNKIFKADPPPAPLRRTSGS